MSFPSNSPGAELAHGFHADIVKPLLAARWPRLRYAAGRLGSGSDVLGLDDEISRDHDWGCRLTVLLDEADCAVIPGVRDLLESELPDRYLGFPVRFPVTWDTSGTHNVEVATVAGFATSRLGVNPVNSLTAVDWLTMTGHSVLEVTAGPIFTDQTSGLRTVSAKLAWYPGDIELYVLSAAWQRIGQRMPMIGRTASRGDLLGSLSLSAAVATDLMRLAFLVHRSWPPYSKWIGSLLMALPSADSLMSLLETAMSPTDWNIREQAIAEAAEHLLIVQRGLGLPAPERAVTRFWGREFRCIDQAVVQLLTDNVRDAEVARLPEGIGSIEQWIDNATVLAHPEQRRRAVSAYTAWMADSTSS